MNSYLTTTSYTGTAVGFLAFDASGNILTSSAAGVLPSQTGNANGILTTDGTNAAWSQKLTVDGTTGQLKNVINSTVGTDYQSTLYDGYLCRAWVTLTITTGTPAVTASGNVSSVTDNGVGLYTLNFTTSMPDTNYALNGVTNVRPSASNGRDIVSANTTNPPAAASLQIVTSRSETNSNEDPVNVYVTIFR